MTSTRRALAFGVLALLIAWAVFAPMFAYTRGHLDGYVKGIRDVINLPRLVPMPTGDRHAAQR